MAHAGTSQVMDRPLRIKLAGSVLVMLRLENGRHIRGKLHQVSTSGGLLHLDQLLAEKIKVEVMFHVGECTVRSSASMLFPMWATQGCLQPFEFVNFAEPERTRLIRNWRSCVTRARLLSPFPNYLPATSLSAAEMCKAEHRATLQSAVVMKLAGGTIYS